LSPRPAVGNPTKTDMAHLSLIPSRRALTASIIIAAAGALPAQTTVPVAPPNARAAEDAIVLSPFTVTEAEDTGYVATSSLAGTRIKTDLRDLAGSISVVTKDFMADLGANSAEELLLYTVGTEAAGTFGNFSGADVAGGHVEFTGALRDPQSGNRVRGLTAADFTRNFYLTSIRFDSYNTQRVDINRGSNAILFGLGSPAGIINHQPIQPTFRRKASAELEYGSFGSRRAVLDVDQPLVPDVAALRFALLDRRGRFEQDQAFENDRRFYGALAVRPWRQTTLRASYETGNIDANRPRLDPPRDTLTRWWEFGRPTHDPANSDFDTINRDFLRGPGNWFSTLGLVYEDSNGALPTDAFNAWQNITRNGRPFVANYVSLTTGEQYANSPSFPKPFGSFYRNNQITDESIFDYRNSLLDGPNKSEWEHFHVFDVSLEQNFTYALGRAGVELAYSRENHERGFIDLLNSDRGYTLNIDVNRTLPYGPPNPNFGRVFVATTANGSAVFRNRETYRATAFGEVDLRKKWDRGLGRWLGRHTGTLLFTNYRLESKNLGVRTVVEGDANLATVHYLGDSLANRPSAAGANLPPIGPLRLLPATFTSTNWNTRTRAWEQRTNRVFDPRLDFDRTVNSGSFNADEIHSYAGVLQSYFFDNLLVSTLGWRQDYTARYNSTSLPLAPGTGIALPHDPSWRLLGTPDLESEGNIFSYGLVAHAPDFVRRRLPWGGDLSLHYNESQNFQPSVLRRNILGEAIPPPSGTTKDYGFTLSLLDRKLVARTTWYETTAMGDDSGLASGIWLDIDARIIEYNTAAQRAAAGYVEPPDYLKKLVNWTEVTLPNGQTDVRYNNPGFRDTTDLVSRGIELELVYNPTSNWRFAFNAAKQQAKRANIGRGFLEYLDKYRRSVWFSGASSQLLSDESGDPVAARTKERLLNDFNKTLQQEGAT
jgi:outer membrane receptor protein involved in Fe transport